MSAEFQMDDHGHFRIRVGNKWSAPTVYQSIAVIETEGCTYIGVSAYFQGSIPYETVLLLSGVPGVKNTEFKGNLYEGVGKFKKQKEQLLGAEAIIACDPDNPDGCNTSIPLEEALKTKRILPEYDQFNKPLKKKRRK